jgi:hypothetical protein
MVHRKKPTGEAYKNLVAEYRTLDHQGKINQAERLGVNPDTVKTWVSEGDTSPKAAIIKEPPTVRELPAIDITPLPVESTEEGEEVQILLISDLQAGQQSPTFNSKVLKQEMINLSDKSLRLCQLHRKMRPIKKLFVLLLGDMIENMNIPIPNLEELEKVVYDQVFEVAVPALNNLLVSQLQLFETVEVYAVKGNHGQLEGKRSLSAKTNWDNFVYKILELGLKNYKPIKFRIELDNFWQVINILSHKYLLVHGDQIPAYLGIPYYGVDRRTLRWNVSIPGDWEACFMAHFHVSNYIRPSGIPIFINGTFASGTSYPLHRLGLQDDPRQWCLFASPKRGITAHYEIRVDEKY